MATSPPRDAHNAHRREMLAPHLVSGSAASKAFATELHARNLPTLCRLSRVRLNATAGDSARDITAHSRTSGKAEPASDASDALLFQQGMQQLSSSSNGAVAAAHTLAVGQHLKGGVYEIQQVLGSGSSATTYQARVRDTGQLVAVKALSLAAMRGWKQLDLFQREAQVLSGLSHPGIPRYLDHFEEDDAAGLTFYIVQEMVQGASLASMLQSGMRCDDREAQRIMRDMCDILSYLASLRPPVVHRDIKPDNILLRGGSWGGHVVLVDFGGVAGVGAAADASTFASTVVGTYGYMAPEQFRGAAQPASDLYALGATLLFLLSGRPPFAFPQERMRIDWHSSFKAPSPLWTQLLDGLLEPVAEDRLTAEQAIDLLDGRALYTRPVPSKVRSQASGVALDTAPARKPAGTRVILERIPNRLDVTIPPKGLLNLEAASSAGFAVVWNAFVLAWTVGALAGGGVLFALFSAPFWFAGVKLGKQALGAALLRERLSLSRSTFSLSQELATLNSDKQQAQFTEGRNQKGVCGETADLLGARVATTMIVNGSPVTVVEVLEGVRVHRFGEGLDWAEQQWLVAEINKAVADLQGRVVVPEHFPPPEPPRIVRDDDSHLHDTQ
ncbi:kinase-like domain-containing protein [Haematococcus lacustris]